MYVCMYVYSVVDGLLVAVCMHFVCMYVCMYGFKSYAFHSIESAVVESGVGKHNPPLPKSIQ